jgi:autotransporter translocation and assembly factor TamB
MWHRLPRLSKIAGCGGFALVLLTLLVYQSAADPILDPLRDLLVRTVTRFISKSLQGTVEIANLRGSLLGSPVLHHVVLRDAQGVVLVQIEAIRLEYDLIGLIKKRLTVRTVDIVRPQLTLAQEPDGSLNITRLLPPSAEEPSKPEEGFSLPFAIVLEQLQIHDGQLTLQLPSLAGVQRVEALQANLQGQIDAQGLRLTLQQLTAHTVPADITLHTFRAAFAQQGGTRRLDDLHIALGNSRITASGVLPGGEQPADVQLHVQPLDAAEIGRLLHNDTLHGQLQLMLQAAGPPEALTVNGQLHAEGGMVEFASQVNTVVAPLQYRGDIRVSTLDLGTVLEQAVWQSDLNLRLQLQGEGQTLETLQGHVQLDLQPSHVGDIAVRPSRIEVEMQPQRFHVAHFNLDTSVAQMTAGGTIDLTRNSDLQYQLNADLAHLQRLAGTKAIGGTVHLQGQVHGESSAVRVNGSLQASRLHYEENRLQNLEMTYDAMPFAAHPQISAQLQAQQAQAGTLPVADLALQATYDGDARQVRFATQVQQSPTYSGHANGNLTLTQTGQQVRIEDLLVQLADHAWQAQAPLEVTHDADRIHVRQFRLAHADESLEISGAIDGQQLQALRVEATQIDLTYLRHLLQLSDLVGGHATLHVQLDGTLGAPRVQGDMVLDPEPQQPFTHLQSTLAYADKQFHSDLRLQQDNREVLTLHLRLPIDLALLALTLDQRVLDGPIEGDVQLVRPDLATLHQWQPTLPEMAGDLQGNLTLKGSYAALTLKAEMQVKQLRVQGIAEQIHAPVQFTADVTTAPSVAELRQALAQQQLVVHFEPVQLRIPTLRGQLPGRDTPPQSVQIDDLLAQVAGQWSAAGLQAQLDPVRLQAEALGLPRTDLTLTASLTPEQFALQRLRVHLAESELRGHGTLAMASQQLQFHVDILRLRLADLTLTPPANLPAEMHGTLDLQGSVPAPELAARLQYAGAQIAAEAAVQLQEKQPRYHATLRVDSVDTAQFLPQAQGTLQALVKLDGNGFEASQRQAHLDVQITSNQFNLAPGLTAHMLTHLDGNAVQLPELRVDSAPANLQAQGRLSATQQVELTYNLTLGDLQAIRDHLQIPIQAKGDLSGTVQGKLDALRANATLQLVELGYADLYGKSLQADVSATNLPNAPKATLTAQLTDLHGPSLPTSSLRLEAHYAQPQGTFSAEVTHGPYTQTGLAGQFDLQEDMQVTLEHLRLQYEKLVWENAAPVVARRDAQGTLSLQYLQLRNGDQEINAYGTLAPEGTVNVEMQIQQLQVQPTVQALSPGTMLPDGQLFLDVTLHGTLEQPRLDGSLQLTSLQWQGNKLGNIQAQLGLANNIARTDLRWQDREGEVLHVYGTAGLPPDGPLDLQLQTPNFDLVRLKPFSSQIRHSAGQLKLDLHILGTLQQPQAQGVLELHDGELQVVATGERYRDMQVRLLFSGNRVDIAQCHVGSRSGTMDLSGGLTFAGFNLEQLEASLQAKDFTAMHTPTIEARISGAVSATGSLQEMAVAGQLQVPRARIRLAGLLGAGPAAVAPWQLTVAGVYGPGPETVHGADGRELPPLQQHPLPFLRADVSVDIPRNAWIQDSGTAVELGGKLRATKDLQGPFILNGSIETLRGFASFYGKKFVLQEGGTVTFTGSPDINPALDVTALYDVSDYRVTIHVEGKAKQPKLTFSSNPELEQTDIISLLIVGKTTDRLTNSERSSLSNQTEAIAGGLVAQQAEKLLGSSLGLDTIEVEAGKNIGTGSVTVGRYVTQDLFLSYGREFTEKGKQGGNKVGVEYSINRQLKLKGSSDDLGETALDFIWRRDY